MIYLILLLFIGPLVAAIIQTYPMLFQEPPYEGGFLGLGQATCGRGM